MVNFKILEAVAEERGRRMNTKNKITPIKLIVMINFMVG